MNRCARGFTLIEVLLAISLAGILLVLVGSALIATQRALAASERFSLRLDEVRAAQGFLRGEFQHIVPLPLGTGVPDAPAVFFGEPAEMRYIASLPAHLGGGLYLQTLKLGNTEAEPWLQVGFAPLAGPNAQRPWGEPQRLLRQVRQLRFAYRGLDAQGRPTAWLPRWPWPERLPQQVQVNIDSQGPIAWPPLQVALRLQPQHPVGGAP